VRTEDNVFQHLEVLKRNRQKRHRSGEFFVEGVRAINRAREHRWAVNMLAYVSERPLSSWARDVLAAERAAVHVELSPHLMDALSDKEEPSELVAVLAIPPDDLDRIPLRDDGLVMVFDRPVSPGNLGSIVRSCDALGADGLIVTGHGADLYDPLTVRASMGSLFSLPVVRLGSPAQVQRWVQRWSAGLDTSAQPVRAAGSARRGARTDDGTANDSEARAERLRRVQVVGGTGDGDHLLDEVDLTGPTVLVVGNETQGLSVGYRQLCDVLVRIPMTGAADSLNVASAASILLYEATRQRRALQPPRLLRRGANLGTMGQVNWSRDDLHERS
jgi:TrmH family RNA methyltransferase